MRPQEQFSETDNISKERPSVFARASIKWHHRPQHRLTEVSSMRLSLRRSRKSRPMFAQHVRASTLFHAGIASPRRIGPKNSPAEWGRCRGALARPFKMASTSSTESVRLRGATDVRDPRDSGLLRICSPPRRANLRTHSPCQSVHRNYNPLKAYN